MELIETWVKTFRLLEQTAVAVMMYTTLLRSISMQSLIEILY